MNASLNSPSRIGATGMVEATQEGRDISQYSLDTIHRGLTNHLHTGIVTSR